MDKDMSIEKQPLYNQNVLLTLVATTRLTMLTMYIFIQTSQMLLTWPASKT